MKYLLFIVGLVTLHSCKKENVGDKLQGTWELRKSLSGWSGTHDYPPGNGNTIEFSNNTYIIHTKLADTAYSYSGTFKIYIGKPCSSSNEQQLIRFDNNSIPSSLTLSDKELTISSTECLADGGTQTYRKIGF